MKSPERIFLSERLASVEDVDAALSNAAEDYHGFATEYIARLDPFFYRQLVFPPLNATMSGWDTVMLRLKGSVLTLLPALPSLLEIGAKPELAETLNLKLMRVSADEAGVALWKPLSDEDATEIRAVDLSRIVESNIARSILTLAPGHFELPSGAHTSHFLRLAECLADLETVDRLVYWVAKELSQQIHPVDGNSPIAVLVDNPSTLILALRLVQALSSTRILCLCLPEYPETQDAEAELSIWLEKRLPTDCKRLYGVISVSSTGSLRKLIAGACERIGVSASFSVLYSTISAPETQAYCELEIEGYQHFSTQYECALCAPDVQSTVFRIDRARYFLHERKIKTIPLPPHRFERQKKFLETYGKEARVLRNHVEDPNDANPRHHAYYVSVEALMRVADFRSELTEKIKKLPAAPDLVVIPPHAVGTELGEFISQELKLDVFYHPDLRLNLEIDADRQLAAALATSKSLLIIDDLAFSGGRIQSYNRAIRESNGKFVVPSNIFFFPLIVLAEKEDEWRKVVRGIESNHPDSKRAVCSLYELQLPNWGKASCPWCAEQRELEKIPPFSDDDSDEQGSRLLDPSGTDGVHWVNHLEDFEIPGFGAQSPILSANSSAVQLLFSCAIAVQHARASGPEADRLNPNGFPMSVLLDVAVMKDFQNEFLIVVCLLRALKKGELSDSLRAFLLETVRTVGAGKQPHDKWAIRELLLAEKRGLIPKVSDDTERHAIYERAKFSAYYTG